MTTVDAPAPATTGEPEPQTEVWTFGGSRISGDAKMHMWIDADGRELYFKARSGHVIGGRYEMRVQRTGDRVVIYGGAGQYLGRCDDVDQAAAWEAAHRAAEAGSAAKRRERRDSANSALAEALEPLKAIARSLRTTADRDAFCAHVLRELARGW